MNKQFLMENVQSDNFSKKESGKFIIAGTFSKADTMFHNIRKYPTPLWENLLNRPSIKADLLNRTMLGELGHPDCVETTAVNVSHIVTKLELRPDKTIYGEAEILDTPSGRILKTLYEAGVKMGISSRGYLPEGSNLYPDSLGEMTVPMDFELITFDFVIQPSAPGANPTIKESVHSKLNTILSEGKSKVNPDVKTYISNLSVKKSLLSESTTAQKSSVKEKNQMSENKVLVEKNEKIKELLSDRDNLLSIIKTLKSRYLISEEAIKDLIKDHNNSQVTANELNTAIGIIEEFKNYSINLEKGLDTQMRSNKKACEIIESLRVKYNDLEESYGIAIQVIENLRDRYTLSEEIIEELKDRYLISEAAIIDLAKGNAISEGVIEDLNNRYTLSEGVIEELRNIALKSESKAKDISKKYNSSLSESVQLKETIAKKQPKKLPKGYFEGISRDYRISVVEAKQIFENCGKSKKAFEYFLSDKKRSITRKYGEFPYMQNGSSIIAESSTPKVTPEQSHAEKLTRMISSQF